MVFQRSGFKLLQGTPRVFKAKPTSGGSFFCESCGVHVFSGPDSSPQLIRREGWQPRRSLRLQGPGRYLDEVGAALAPSARRCQADRGQCAAYAAFARPIHRAFPPPRPHTAPAHPGPSQHLQNPPHLRGPLTVNFTPSLMIAMLFFYHHPSYSRNYPVVVDDALPSPPPSPSIFLCSLCPPSFSSLSPHHPAPPPLLSWPDPITSLLYCPPPPHHGSHPPSPHPTLIVATLPLLLPQEKNPHAPMFPPLRPELSGIHPPRIDTPQLGSQRLAVDRGLHAPASRTESSVGNGEFPSLIHRAGSRCRPAPRDRSPDPSCAR